MAKVMAYGGYAYLLLAEGFCDAPVNLSAPLKPAELFARGIARFDTAVAAATAYRASTTVAANIAAATDIINMANVGAARAALKLGDLAKAKAHAALVPAGYEKLALYSANTVRENNALNRPLMFSGWTPSSVQIIDITTNIKFATALEAQYIIVEANGSNQAMLDFVSARRAVGNQAPVNLAGAPLVAEFRNQRARDFFVTGQSLGDLRRYLAAGTDMFPKASIPSSPTSTVTRRASAFR